MKIIFVAICLFLMAGTGKADELHQDLFEEPVNQTIQARHRDVLSQMQPPELIERSRLMPYRHNTFSLYQQTKGDQYAMEVNYSFKYLFTRPDCFYEVGDEQQQCKNDWDKRNELYFSYTGKFDFYVGGTGERDSGPVINRMSNPALHWRFYQPEWIALKWIDYGLEHRSNGQTTSATLKDASGNYIANNEWKAEHRAYIDGISRGSNYISVEGRNDLNIFDVGIKYWLSGKIYHNNPESDVTWGDGQYQNHKIWDYDIARAVFETEQMINNASFPKIVYSVEYTVGKKGLPTDSANISFTFPWVASATFPEIFSRRTVFPIFFRLHTGPMNELSNYTVAESTFYIGLALDPFPERN